MNRVALQGMYTYEIARKMGVKVRTIDGSNEDNLNGRIDLSQEQRHVLDLVKSGENVFFTGPAGTGKSVLLRKIIGHLKEFYDEPFNPSVAVTASTGIAALNIGGRTLHSFAGIGLGKESAERLCKNLRSFARQRWKQTKVLIVDEISMVDGVLFDKLEWIARKVTGKAEPFGGIQLILSGDFFQLPPVPEKSHQRIQPVMFAFDAKTWTSCISRPIFLTQVFRQKDAAFVDILSNMRYGCLTDRDIQSLKSLSRPLDYPDGIQPTELYPLRDQVHQCNISRLEALPGPLMYYQAMDFAGHDIQGKPLPAPSAETLLERLVALKMLFLKVGALVMLIQNMDEDLVNGSRGIVLDFLDVSEAQRRGINIAQTTGRSKPKQTLQPTDEIRPLSNHIFARDNPWPLVRFESGRELLCAPLQFTCEGPIGNTEASRTQVPLILAWALSIHKSQGQTLQRVKVDIGRAFEKGQVYVALSRAKSMDGLQIDNFEPSKVEAHPRVVEWHRTWNNSGEEFPYQ